MSESIQALLAQVVGYYRSPLNYPGFTQISNPLPDALFELLEMVNESGRAGSRLLENAQQLKVPVDELSQAIFFYIKQVLFAPGADYYRTLGLSQNASSDVIRLHYRLLIRLFHPDRNPQGEIWDNQYATKINEAYNTLKRPEKRDSYDNRSGADRQVPEERAKHSGPAVRSRQSEQPLKFSGSLLQQLWGSYLWQRHPKALVIGIVGSGMLLVLLMAAMSGNESALEITEGIDNPPAHDLNENPADERREAFMRAIGSDTDTKERTEKTPHPPRGPDSNASVNDERNDQQILQQIGVQLATQKAKPLGNESIEPGDPRETAGSHGAAAVSSITAIDKPATESTVASSERAGEQAIAQLLAENTMQIKSSTPAKESTINKTLYAEPAEIQKEQSRPKQQPVKHPETAAVAFRENTTPVEQKASVKADREPETIPDQALPQKIVVKTPTQTQDARLEVSEVKVAEAKTQAVRLEDMESNDQEKIQTPVSAVPVEPKPNAAAQSSPAFVPRGELLAQSDELLMKYISYYEAGNLLGIMDLFSPGAVVDGRRGIEHVATRFDASFRNAQKRKVELHEFKRTQTGAGEVVMDVQAGILEFDAHGDVSRQYQVGLKLHLIESNEHLLISQYVQTR